MNNSINTLRTLAIESIEKANSGHPGICMGAAPMMYAVYNENLNVDLNDTNWINRDRFVMSAGHGSALLYSVMHLAGYDLSIEDLKNFRQLNSKTPGHPENFITKGIDVSTGPLGQGLATAVGLAMAEKYLSAKLNKGKFNIIDHHTYVLCGDGDLFEGISYESCSYAGHNNLDKLIVLYDSNDISLDGDLSLTFSEDIKGRFEAQKWHYIKVEDGEDLNAINKAIKEAKSVNKPVIIEIKTIIGYGSDKKAGTSSSHGAPLGAEELEFAKNTYGITNNSFEIDDEVYADFKNNFAKRGTTKRHEWDLLVKEYSQIHPKEYKLLNRLINNENISLDMKAFNEEVATRISSQHAINQIADQDELFIGGSADLSCSNNTTIKTDGKFILDSDADRNIYFGVREFAMGAMVNGMALHSNLNVFASTFFVFSDYLKPAIRLSALMNIGTNYVFTHDSIAVGEDGPTHQPVEQLSMFRSMPNTQVIRPCDANETQAAWEIAHQTQDKPTILALTRQNLPTITDQDYQTTLNNLKRGAYVIHDSKDFDRIIIATGSEVNLAIKTAKLLEEKGIIVRVVSMPCQEIFSQQDDEYFNSVLPMEVKIRYSFEMGSSYGWEKFTRCKYRCFGINDFGLSGNGNEIIEEFGFTPEKMADLIAQDNLNF